MRKKLLGGPAFAALLLTAGGCGTAMASLVTYNLVGATTAGGASLTGSFVYDSVLDKLASVSIHETADLVYGTAATTFTSLLAGFPGGLLNLPGGYKQFLFQDDNVAGNSMVISARPKSACFETCRHPARFVVALLMLC